ncbi:MAG: adenylate/guanylate cyclase domain-containing protein [Saprospiraceae bacterium]|nr:adenylate/guanylate cyclase domain-containing protein [Saprospiraceae bacterium]
MGILQAGRRRIKLGRLAWIILVWTVLGALDALNTHVMTNSEYVNPTRLYDFNRYFWVNTLAAFAAGIISGSILVFFLRERFRNKAFGFTILVNSLVISLINFGIIAVIYDVFFSLESGKNPLHSEVLEETATLIQSSFYLKNLVFWSIVAFLTIVFLHVNDKYGPGMLMKLILGLYHRPRQEERIFMFVDIKSSTTIAERLGHIRFFNLLNDFFKDLTDPIIYTGGEIYQYVGDEVVISWTMKRGLQNENCLRCFYSMQEAINRRAARYRERYGLVPEFKAGLHCGEVTIGEIGVIKKDIVFSGDVLNTAHRIQAICNRYGVKILISKYLLDRLQLPPNDFHPQRVGVIELKGKQQKLEIYTFSESHLPEEIRLPALST